MSLVKLIAEGKTEVAAAAISHVAPSTSATMRELDTGWARGGFKLDTAIVYLGPASAGTIQVSDAMVFGYDPVRDEIVYLQHLNQGDVITLTTTRGFSQRIIDVGVYSHLCVVDTGDSGTHVYGFIPIERL